MFITFKFVSLGTCIIETKMKKTLSMSLKLHEKVLNKPTLFSPNALYQIIIEVWCPIQHFLGFYHNVNYYFNYFTTIVVMDFKLDNFICLFK